MMLPEKLVGPDGEWEEDSSRKTQALLCKVGPMRGRQNPRFGFSSELGLPGREGEGNLCEVAGLLLLLGT